MSGERYSRSSSGRSYGGGGGEWSSSGSDSGPRFDSDRRYGADRRYEGDRGYGDDRYSASSIYDRSSRRDTAISIDSDDEYYEEPYRQRASTDLIPRSRDRDLVPITRSRTDFPPARRDNRDSYNGSYDRRDSGRSDTYIQNNYIDKRLPEGYETLRITYDHKDRHASFERSRPVGSSSHGKSLSGDLAKVGLGLLVDAGTRRLGRRGG